MDALAAIGIPQWAVAIELISGHPMLAASVLDGIRPTGAGLVTTSTPGECTMGFNVTDNSGVAYFLTASHCTKNYSGPTGVAFYQNTSAPLNLVGYEQVNPAWTNSGCGYGAVYCANVDAALVAYTSGVTRLKRVAQTSFVGSGNTAGNRTIGTWYNVGAIAGAGTGATVFKTGKNSGTTSGSVVGTCVNIGLILPDSVEVYCGTEVQAKGAVGDSGGPVYRELFVLQPSERAAIGIVYAHWLKPNGINYFYFSALSDIATHLGVTIIPY